MRRALVLLCIAAARDHGAAIADDDAAAGLERAKRWRDGCGFRGYAATDAAPDAPPPPTPVLSLRVPPLVKVAPTLVKPFFFSISSQAWSYTSSIVSTNNL